MIDFLIFYEVGVREFESIALLGYELKRRGYTVEYFGFEDADQNKYIKNRKRLRELRNNVDTVIMPSLYHDKELYNTVYYVCGECMHVVNLRWEQYFENGSMNDCDSVLFPHDDAVNAYHLCWGNVSRQSLLARGIDEGLLPITGAIHLDFSRKEFSSYYESKASIFLKYGLAVDKKTVLYISSFAIATYTKRLIEAVRKDFDGKYDGLNESTVLFHRKSYEITIDWIEKFLKLHPDIQFIYRPHPTENLTDYISRLKKYDNFYIISDCSVKQWIICCDIITTWVSTSITEAFFAGKYCYVIRPVSYPYDDDICIYNGVRYIDKIEDFLEISNPKEFSSVSEEQIREYYSVMETPAYIRVADALEKIKDSGRVFEWKKDKMKKIDIKRKLLFFKNVVFDLYIFVLRRMLNLNAEYNINFPKKLQSRIDNFKIVKEKTINRNLTFREELAVTVDKVNNYMSENVNYGVEQ